MKYIALTLGPITRTIEMAENTRSLWAASYLFSYLGKKIIEPFKDRSFLLPYISSKKEEGMFTDRFQGAGVFPDRYIFEAKDGDFDKLSKHVGDVIRDIATEINRIINPVGKDEVNQIETYLKRYLKVYFLEKDYKIADNKTVKDECEKSLSLLEMQDSIVPKVNDEELFLNRFFDRVPGSFLATDAGLGERFPTIVQISSGDNVEIPQHPYQRYVAVVKADGDSMGKAFKKTNDANALSKALFEFNKKAVEIIRNDYDGLPVYIGGDDLLFFAPIYTKKGSVFSLLLNLDTAFHDSIIENTDLKNQEEHPTLSFGVSISYYKYPMFEALELADKLLTKAKAGDGEKNNIVFSILKHSGQTRAALLHKGNVETLKDFNTFVNDYIKIIEGREDNKEDEKEEDIKENKKMLASVMHGLREKEPLLSVAIKQDKTLRNFFDNNFNESEHKKYADFFEDIRKLLWAAYYEFPTDKLEKLKKCLPQNMMVKNVNTEELIPTPEKAAIETAYNALQFVHLVNQRNDERDESF